MNLDCERAAIEEQCATNAEPHVKNGACSANHKFLLFAASLLHQYGTPSFRFEAAMASVSRSLGIRGSFLYSPTSFIASFEEGGNETTYLRRVDAEEVDIYRLLAFDRTLDELAAGTIVAEDAHSHMSSIASSKPLYNDWLNGLAGAFVCGSVAALFGGGVCDIVAAFTLGIVVKLVAWGSQKWSRDCSDWITPLSGFVAAFSTIAVAYVVPIDYRITTLAVLILPIPGLSLTIALTELAVGHLASGSARFAGAATQLLTLAFGVAVAWQLAHPEMTNFVVTPVPNWCQWLAMFLAPVAFGIIFRSPVSLWPAIVATSIAGAATSRFMAPTLGPELGAFLGALIVGLCSNFYARTYNRPAMALLTPGLLILVPGSIGYRSLTAMFERNTLEGIELGATMIMTGASLVGGILIANGLLSPKRCL